MALPHLPILRRGKPYRSVDTARVPDFETREPLVEVSQANPGLVRRDLLEESQAAMRASLASFSMRELVTLSARAAELFMAATLPLGEGAQTPDDYVRQLSATTGLPHVMVRKNMEKIRAAMGDAARVIAGLTRGLDLDVLDKGYGEVAGAAVSFIPRSPTLGVVLPNNSPGVHALWVPTIALRTALVLKPGSAEPWTPYRVIQAFVRAGVPADASASTRPTTPARARSCAAAGAAWCSATWPPPGPGRPTRASRCTGPATARWCSGPTRAPTGRSTST